MLLKLLFMTFFSVVWGDSQWYAGSGLTDKEVSLLLQRGCFHGRYGGNPSGSTLILSSCPGENLKPIGIYSKTTPLCVIEFDRNLSEKLLSQAEIMIDAHNHSKLLLKHGRDLVISSLNFELCDLTAFSESWVMNVVTVPSFPYRQPRSNVQTFNLSEPDPTIADALAKVSAISQRAFLEKLTAFYTRQSQSNEAEEAAEYLEQTYTQYGFDVSRYDFRQGYSPNVVAELKGTTHPEQIVVVGAHYDSRSTDSSSTTQRAPGADDNGSGTINLLELARIISETELQFEYTIRICSFSGEEQGLLGSRAMAKAWADAGVDVIAMFNGDMLGWVLPDQPIILGMKDRYISEELLSIANTITSLYVPELPIGLSSSCCSDHQGFTEAGYRAIGFFENPGSASDYPHYHRSTDLIQYVDFTQVALISKAMMANVMVHAVPA